MSEESSRNTRTYGFRTNVHRKSTEVGIRWEFLEKYVGKTYEIAAIKFVLLVAFVLIGGSGLAFYLLFNLQRALYVAIGLVIVYLAIALFLLMWTLTDISSGSLFDIARTFRRYKARQRAVKNGREEPYRDTGDGKVDDRGYIDFKDGSVGKVQLIDGLTSPTAFPDDIIEQITTATAWQQARPRGVTEIKLSTVQPQNTNRQVRELKRRSRITDIQTIKEICEQQTFYLENNIEGQMLTTVQYILFVAPNKKALDTYLETMKFYVQSGLYYSVTNLGKEATEELLTDMRHLI